MLDRSRNLLLVFAAALVCASRVGVATAPGPLLEGGGQGADPSEEEGYRLLEADLPRQGEQIAVGGQEIRYRLVGVLYNTAYVVTTLVSTPGPARLSVWLEVEGSGRRRLRNRAHRKLLAGAESVCFSTGVDKFGGYILQAAGKQFDSADIVVNAQQLWSWLSLAPSPEMLRFDIALESTSHQRLLLAKLTVIIPAVAAALAGLLYLAAHRWQQLAEAGSAHAALHRSQLACSGSALSALCKQQSAP